MKKKVLKRLKKEYVKLYYRTHHLDTFIGSNEFNRLEKKQQEILSKQLVPMLEYATILEERLEIESVDTYKLTLEYKEKLG